MNYQVIKTFGPESGLSCSFRQWRAQSHCRFLHGYALGVRITFAANELDEHNWVYDFGNLKWLKDWLAEQFDHTTLIAADDPELNTFKQLAEQGLIQLRILPHVGCEQFAKWICDFVAPKVAAETHNRVQVQSVEVFEHGANSAVALP